MSESRESDSSSSNDQREAMKNSATKEDEGKRKSERRRTESEPRDPSRAIPKDLVFKKQLTPTDIRQGIRIKNSKAATLFPSKICGIVKLECCDDGGKTYLMELNHYISSDETAEAYQIHKGWKQFVNDHHLKANDSITLYKDNNRYHIRYEKAGAVANEGDKSAKPKATSYLFEVKLRRDDFFKNTLTIPRVFAENHFLSDAEINTEVEITFLSDCCSDTWNTKFSIPSLRSPWVHLIVHGWREFLERRELKAKDLIRFTKPVDALRMKYDNKRLLLLDHAKLVFEKQLTKTDADNTRLTVSKKFITEYFSPGELRVWDDQEDFLEMELEQAPHYCIARGWQDVKDKHHLAANDSICFYKTIREPSSRENSYLFRYEKARRRGKVE